MTIEIIGKPKLQEDFESGISAWACLLEVSQVTEAYLLPATAPGTLLEADLQAHFDAQEAGLFALAQVKGLDVNQIYDRIPKRALRAALLLILDEINILRGLHGLAERTPAQARAAFKNKLKSF